MILSKRKSFSGSPFLLKIVSESQFSGKTYFIQLPPDRRQARACHNDSEAAARRHGQRQEERTQVG